jgi:glycosyltransferase involved in cell wall biosynthesis
MKILSIHNHYQQPGGEDTAVELETAMLREAGHEVIEYRRSNREVTRFTLGQKALLPQQMIWSTAAHADVRTLVVRHRPDVAHFHNIHFMISPSAYYACQELSVPVVQTVHNYRLLCPAANFLRDGRVCEDCLGKRVPWPGVLHACYRNSRLQTSMVAASLTVHRWRRTWVEQVNRYIVLTEFLRQKLIQGGIPDRLLAIKPNVLHPDPGFDHLAGEEGNYLLYVGRLSEEKGIHTLVDAWRRYAHTEQPMPTLRIVGEGPLRRLVATAGHELPSLEFLGQQERSSVLALMRRAKALIFPSICYEVLPLVILEAYAVGLPVIASDLGSAASLIEPGMTGLHFRHGDSEDLAVKIAWMAMHDRERDSMRLRARAEFEGKYTVQQNHRTLVEIYTSLCGAQESNAGMALGLQG